MFESIGAKMRWKPKCTWFCVIFIVDNVVAVLINQHTQKRRVAISSWRERERKVTEGDRKQKTRNHWARSFFIAKMLINASNTQPNHTNSPNWNWNSLWAQQRARAKDRKEEKNNNRRKTKVSEHAKKCKKNVYFIVISNYNAGNRREISERA